MLPEFNVYGRSGPELVLTDRPVHDRIVQRLVAGPSESRVRAQLVQFLRRERAKLTLPALSLEIDKDGNRCPGNMKAACFAPVEMIAQSAQQL